MTRRNAKTDDEMLDDSDAAVSKAMSRTVNTDDRLRLLVESVERLEEEKKGIGEDIRDKYSEMKAVGYDTKIVRKVVALRKMKPDDRAEMEMLLDTYKAALGLG